jgi:major membrane immunogen (membrane-anchored lipoprotein)
MDFFFEQCKSLTCIKIEEGKHTKVVRVYRTTKGFTKTEEKEEQPTEEKQTTRPSNYTGKINFLGRLSDMH